MSRGWAVQTLEKQNMGWRGCGRVRKNKIKQKKKRGGGGEGVGMPEINDEVDDRDGHRVAEQARFHSIYLD